MIQLQLVIWCYSNRIMNNSYMRQDYVENTQRGMKGNRWGNGLFVNECRGYERIRKSAENSFQHNRRPDVRRKLVIATKKEITLELGVGKNNMTGDVESGEINDNGKKKRKVNDENKNQNKLIGNEVMEKMKRNRLYVKMFFDVMEKHYMFMETNLKKNEVNSNAILKEEKENSMYMEMFYDVMKKYSLFMEDFFAKEGGGLVKL